MASWKSPWWLLVRMVFMNSALLQVIGRGRGMVGISLFT